MKRIGIIGYGVVGKAFVNVFKDKVKIFIYDKYISEYNDIERVVKNCPIVFVAVPTPMYEDGSIDISCVEDALKSILAVNLPKKKLPVVVIRSTIVPGTTAALQKKFPSLHLVYNPEFLSERNSLADMERTDRVVIGGHLKYCKKVEEIYRLVFPYARYIITDTTTAEMIKYAANVTLAGQVMIANELYQICQKLGVDWAFVRNAIILDPLIGRNTKVPGPDGDMGFGGKCLPKDLNALIYRARELGYNPELLIQIWKSNLKVRKNRNWEVIKGATSKKRKHPEKN
ncbi:MAG TPA: nucleotide sugar dehydrogenase [bacterium]|nr:nucleotide sugar dehydrogenase [bacterium]HPP29872.1 nucleotide sugar dehydrogenase [bacterium]